MASKVSSGQSEIYRARMLPVVSSAHGSLPRDARKDTHKTKTGSDVSGRKTQPHGFKPLFPLDTSNFVSKIVDRNSQDQREAKPRLVSNVSSAIVKPSPLSKETRSEVKVEEREEVPPTLPPRKKLPQNPPSPGTVNYLGSQIPISMRHHGSQLPVRTERRTLPTPQTPNQSSVTSGTRKLPSNRFDRPVGETSIRREEISHSYRNKSEYNLSKPDNSENLRNGEAKTHSKSRLSQNSVGDYQNANEIRNESKSDASSSDINSDTKPLTRTNVTQHDKIWVKEEPRHPPGTLSPPLQEITPETTEELWNNYDPLDNLDSGSESSADTMIMMTTEEEQKNEEKIRRNQKHFESSKGTVSDTTLTREESRLPNVGSYYPKHSSNIDLSPKSSEEDDGYGTNSSTSTNFSSLSSLGIGDVEQKPLHGILKKTGHSMPNGLNGNAIYTHTSQNKPSQSTWAVKRRTKIAESQDNSLQEKLRQLAIIEEENTHDEIHEDRLGIGRRNSDAGSFGYSSDNDSHWKSVVNSAPPKCESQMIHRSRPSEEEEKQEEVIQNDLKKFEGELYDKLTDMDLNYRNYYGFDNSQADDKDSPKVLYFKDKVIKQQYDSDNYYNPSSYQNAMPPSDFQHSQTLPSQSHRRNMPELCQRAYSNNPHQPQNYGQMNGYESQNASYRSLASSTSGHHSSYDYVTSSNDNISIHSGHSMPGNLYKTKYVSVDNINQNGRKTVFASSADIYNLFQSKENLATQLQRPASYRHSFHAVPVTIASGKADPNDIFNEKTEPRPRSSSTSVGSKNKWNPFGNLFGKKRKSSTSGENSKSDKSKDSNQGSGRKTQTLRKTDVHHPQLENRTPEMLPRRQLVEENGPIVPPVIKSSTLPRNVQIDKVFPDKPFKTMALFEESGTKLSTLV